MDIAVAVRQTLLILVGNIMCFILLDRKYDLKNTLIIYGGITAAVIALNLPITALFGRNVFTALFPLTTNSTTTVTLFFLSKRKGFPLLFNMMTSIFFASITVISAGYLTLEMEQSIWMEILIRLIISIPLIIILYRYLRPSYLKMLTVMKKGWGYLCLIPGLFYILGMLNAIQLSPMPAPAEYRKVYLNCFLSLMIVLVAYGVIFTLFTRIILESEMHDEQQLLKIQVQAMERHANALKENEEKVRIYRHDLRHYIAQIKVLIESGDTEEALRVLGSFNEQNRNTSVPFYCNNPTVNAILVYYTQKAEHEGITVKADCRLSEKLPAEASELAMVLANAIENAIHGCGKVPEDRERLIKIKLVSSSQLALEIVNSYTGIIEFDKNGLPVSTEIGHGLGTKSISAFVEKYDGIIEYSTDGTLFRLRLLVGA